ncbi:MAG TPA: 16S rRNA (guanine(966)-N(2))-methyltransferase RsmD [Bacteroidia bacterium]|nr:16S rRNA (guanine(966)-N(2))-methyltransferase RsmD [Bacteroidia bacterium]
MIRIISGSRKGRKIQAPSNLPVRPTTDFAKEGLFNVLVNKIDFEEVKFLDLFAGTGNISYEMASRGCTNITCVDNDSRCLKFISETANKLEFQKIKTVRSDAYAFIKSAKSKWDLIFVDPPYEDVENTGTIPKLIFEKEMLEPGGLLIIEHPERIHFTDRSHLLDTRKYGKVNFSFFGFEE